jgi:hypothetical protein
MSDGFHANTSTFARRKVMSAISYVSPNSTLMVTVFLGSSPRRTVLVRAELSGDRCCFVDGWADDPGHSTSSEDVVATAS